MLEIRPLCVCEITAVLNLAVSTVSKHLSILKANGFIYDVYDRKWVIYHLNPYPENRCVRQLSQFLSNWNTDKVIVADRDKVNKIDRTILCQK